MMRVWSEQQQAFIDWAQHGTGSCVLVAVAGAGKTTTLIEAASRMSGNVAIMAYNKKIGDEIAAKVSGFGHIKAGTVHSFGMQAFRNVSNRFKVDGWKVTDILKEKVCPQGFLFIAPTAKLVSYAKNRALGVFGQIENRAAWYEIAEHFDVFSEIDKLDSRQGERNSEDEADVSERNAQIVEYAIKGLALSNRKLDVIDFDDMVYLPLIHKCMKKTNQYEVIIIDEAQDTNPARRALAGAMLAKGGRLIAVGDPNQAIYGFTGADNDSLEQIKRDFSAIEMPLTVTYRCPKSVVNVARQWVDHITAHESAPEGSYTAMTWADFIAQKNLDGNCAVLCRVTAPLVKAAFQLIRARIPCKVEGREIGETMKKLATRWTRIRTLTALSDKLTEYAEKEIPKLKAKRQETKAAQVEDMVETLRVIIDQCQQEGKTTVADAVAYIDSLFADNVRGVVVLSTIHKSKGREWNRVFWYDRAGTCPSKYARQAWQVAQETNLQYVAATRAQSELIELEKMP